jgi:hypothetical protein
MTSNLYKIWPLLHAGFNEMANNSVLPTISTLVRGTPARARQA